MNWFLCLAFAFTVLFSFTEAKSVTRCKFPGHPANGYLTGDWINRLEGATVGILCDYGYQLKGAGRAVCKNGQWDATLGTCEAVTCQPLNKIPLVVSDPPSCFTKPSPYSTLCRLSCPPGYGHNGALHCEIDGKWYGPGITCKDSQRPDLKCPSDSRIVLQSDPGQSTTKVRLPTPSYSDNSEAYGGKLKFSATLEGKPVSLEQDVVLSISQYYLQVVYLVTDEAGNERECRFSYRVEDKEPPKISRCPSDIIRTTGKNDVVRVTWEAPTATDNSGEEPRLFCDRPNGAEFYEGTHQVNCAFDDRSGNKATCRFSITVKRPCIDHPDFPIASINPQIALPDPRNACSYVAADLKKCVDAVSPYIPGVVWKQVCRKTCKVC